MSLVDCLHASKTHEQHETAACDVTRVSHGDRQHTPDVYLASPQDDFYHGLASSAGCVQKLLSHILPMCPRRLHAGRPPRWSTIYITVLDSSNRQPVDPTFLHSVADSYKGAPNPALDGKSGRNLQADAFASEHNPEEGGGRHRKNPPKGFDQWWDFTRKHNVKIVDDC